MPTHSHNICRHMSKREHSPTMAHMIKTPEHAALENVFVLVLIVCVLSHVCTYHKGLDSSVWYLSAAPSRCASRHQHRSHWL